MRSGPAADAGGSAARSGAVAAASAASTRAAQVRADDREIGRLSGELPPGTILVVAAPADDSTPHLRLIIVSGPGYHSGQLAAASTRQPGMTLLPDLTRSVLGWRGQPVPADEVGSPVTRGSRGRLTAAIRGLIGQDTAAQVYKATMTWFFLIVGVGYVAFFGLVAVLPWGRRPGPPAPPPGHGQSGGCVRRRRPRGHLPGQPGAMVAPQPPRPCCCTR